MSARGMLEGFLFDGVLVEPGDCIQPMGNGGTGTTPGSQIAGEAFDVDTTAADGEQIQGPPAAPGSEVAQVKRVRLACQTAVAGQEGGEGEPFGVGENGPDRGERSGRTPVVIGHIPAGCETDGLGQLEVPAIDRNLNSSALASHSYVTTCSEMRR